MFSEHSKGTVGGIMTAIRPRLSLQMGELVRAHQIRHYLKEENIKDT